MRIALAALGFVNGDTPRNLQTILTLMAQYAGQADLVLFGEAFLQGFDAANFDPAHDRSVALKADADRNRLITAQEIFEYTRRRVMHYLSGADVTQTVHLYPEGDQTVLFGRSQ